MCIGDYWNFAVIPGALFFRGLNMEEGRIFGYARVSSKEQNLDDRFLLWRSM